MSEIDVTKCIFHSANNGFTGAYCTACNNYCMCLRNCYFKQLHRYKQAINEIKGLAQSINDAFEEDDVEQQLSYCKDIGFQIEKICEDI